MTYTEIKERNGRRYYYRVASVRNGNKISKKRIYLGANLKEDLADKESEADKRILSKKRVDNLNNIKSKIIPILKKNRIKKAGIFGSYSRGEQKKDSDIDILIEPAENTSLLDISGLKIELEKPLGKKVDIVSYKYIHPYLKKKILDSEIRII